MAPARARPTRSSSTTRCTGCSSTTWTACVSTPRTPCRREPAPLPRRARAEAADRSCTERVHRRRRGRPQPRHAATAGHRRRRYGLTASGPTTSTTPCAGPHRRSRGYFEDFTGSTTEIARIVGGGWLFAGSTPPYGGARGHAPPAWPIEALRRLPPEPRPGREPRARRAAAPPGRRRRLARGVRPAAAGAAHARSCSWARSGRRRARSCFFTDHGATLGATVSEGRRREFASFAAFAVGSAPGHPGSPGARHVSVEPPRLGGNRAARARRCCVSIAIRWRCGVPWSSPSGTTPRSRSPTPSSGSWSNGDGDGATLVVCALRGPATVSLGGWRAAGDRGPAGAGWQVALSTESPDYVASPEPIVIDWDESTVTFARAGALVLTTCHG